MGKHEKDETEGPYLCRLLISKQQVRFETKAAWSTTCRSREREDMKCRYSIPPLWSPRNNVAALGRFARIVRKTLDEDPWQNSMQSCDVFLENVVPDTGVFWFNKWKLHCTGELTNITHRYWDEKTPCEMHERTLHSQRVTVCCPVAISCSRSVLLEENNKTVTVTWYRYVHKLRTFLQGKLIRPLEGMISASANFCCMHANANRNVFKSPNLLSRPACSADLAPCDLFLRSNLKVKAYACT